MAVRRARALWQRCVNGAANGWSAQSHLPIIVYTLRCLTPYSGDNVNHIAITIRPTVALSTGVMRCRFS